MIIIKMKKEISKRGTRGFRILEIKGAYVPQKLPREYLSFDPETPAVIAVRGAEDTRGLCCWGSVNQRIWGAECPGCIYEESWYTVEQVKCFRRYLRAAVEHLRKINRETKNSRQRWEGEVLFINGEEG